MSYILFIIFSSGAAPITQEFKSIHFVEFDDRVVCEATIEAMKRLPRYTVDGYCLPKGKAGVSPDARKRIEDRLGVDAAK